MARVRLMTRKDPFFSILSPLRYCQSFNRPKTLKMSVAQSNSKRTTCPSCSKPSRLCLCTRIQNPGLGNKVSVTILQHSLEKKHPLNSVRIAKLGLKNVKVATVSDVNFGARFVIRLLESDSNGEAAIFLAIGKNGIVSDLNSKWPELQGPNLDQLLASQVAIEALSRGFTVKKYQKRQVYESINLEEYEEFEIEIPSGSVLLFPSERAAGVDELREMNIEVKNLIVLDGTWAKAKRVYKENPWLRILPHVKLDISKLSLYSEVRHQPRTGCLSTIESVVYALKAVGDRDNHQGLDHLLNVFESMVADQRRRKDERIRNSSPL